jgi:hypothetical protein
LSDGHDGGHGRRRRLSGSSGKHARFTLLLHTGDAFYITKHAHVPLKLIPPYGHVDPGEIHGVHADVCDVAEGEKAYIGLKGAGECADYELKVEWFEGSCAEMEFNDATLEAIVDTSSDVVDVERNHFELGSCEPNSYVHNPFYKISVCICLCLCVVLSLSLSVSPRLFTLMLTGAGRLSRCDHRGGLTSSELGDPG